MLHKTVSRKGGLARSPHKTLANRAKAVTYWKGVRRGEVQPPRRYRKPPSLEEISQKLGAYCRRHGILQLEIFGSAARGETRPGSDVDLMATFRANPGIGFFAMEEEMAGILGVPVHLLTRESVEAMTNPYRQKSILSEARVIYGQSRP